VPVRFLLSSLAIAGLLAAAEPAPAAAGPGAPATMPIAAGVDALAEAADLPRPAPHATICLEVIRRLHAGAGADTPALADRRRAVAAVLEREASGAAPDLVPLPFPTDVWVTGAFSRRAPANLAQATLMTPRTAWLYYGAMGLDDETRAWFAAAPARLERMGVNAGVFAAFAPSLRIRAGHVDAPGGDGAAAVWSKLLDAPADDAPAFVEALFAQRAGRIAWLYDTLSRLDAGQQRHLFAGDTKAALARLRRLADVFERVNLEWHVADRPLWRPRVDPSALLIALEAAPDGTLRVPLAATSWAATLGKTETVDAAWLAERVFLDQPAKQYERFELVRFAARWQARSGGTPPRAALALFDAAPLAALLLERVGAIDDALAGRLLGLITGPAMRRDAHDPRLLQAALAVVERAFVAGTLDAATASGLIGSLVDRIAARGAAPGVADWLADEALPAFRRGLRSSASDDALIVDALAGPGPATPARVDWEGQRYVVDGAAAARERMGRVFEATGRASITGGIAAVRSAALRGNGDAARASVAAAGAELADALIAPLYAAALPAGDPELLASRVDRRHDLDGSERPGAAADRRRWQLAEPLSGGGVPWHLAGSLIALDVAVAVPALRRISDDPPSPVLPAADRLGFARTVALLRPTDTTDASRDTVLRLVAEGKQRLAALAAAPEGAAAAAGAAGLSAWRREALRWSLAHDPGAVPRALSTTELVWLGGPQPADRAALDAWGTSVVSASGELATRFPPARPWEDAVGHDASAGLATSLAELNLRVAAFLADRTLPSTLAPAILSAATLELVDRVNAPRADDWRAVVEGIRTIPDTRLEDYVAALTADGPLRPVRDGETGQ